MLSDHSVSKEDLASAVVPLIPTQVPQHLISDFVDDFVDQFVALDILETLEGAL